jgi:hypothetical protein
VSDPEIFCESIGMESSIFLPALDITPSLGNIYAKAVSLPE